MIDFFTDPYKDELIYSAIARYHFYSGNADFRDTIEECFGKRTMIPTLELGGRLDYLANELGRKYTAEKIINNNTIFPYYSPFIDLKRKNEVLDYIKFKGCNSIYTKLGMVAGSVCKKNYIYYCPTCAKKEIELYGETYIHREHQLQGIILCPHDGCKLKRYVIRKLDSSRIEYVRLEEKYLSFEIKDTYVKNYDKHLKLAKSSYYLLNDNLKDVSKDKIYMKYRALLYKNGLLKGNNTINQKELYEQFVNYYGKAFLKQLDSEIDYYNEYNWLKVISRKSKRASHPLRHLLFINFLCEDFKDFFNNIDACKVEKIKKRNEVYVIENANLEKLEAYKDIILKTIKNNKVFSRTDIRNECKKEYMYLYRYDKKWLFSNLPIKIEVNIDNQRIDWNERDKQYLKLLKEKYKELIKDDRMIRITKGNLAKPLGILVNIEKKLEQLPLTKSFFDEVCESTKEFQMRRAKVIIDKQIDAGVEGIRMWKIQRIAGIRSEQFKNIKVELQNYLEEKQVKVNYGGKKKT